MLTAPESFLLCRPHGGLNDTLCQIERCWMYAVLTGRTLLVDARRSNFFPRISDFFVPRTETPAVRFDPDEHMLERLDALTCFPGHLRGCVATHRARRVGWGDAQAGAGRDGASTFDFRRRYREQVLVHENSGGGRKSCHFLERVVLQSAIRAVVLDRLAPLEEGYLAVHVRNTDIRTDAERLFDRIAPAVRGRTLLVCSDDARVVDRARRFFASSRVVTVSDVPEAQGVPLHFGAGGCDDAARRTQAIDAVVDLLALGGADAVFYATDSVLAGAKQTRPIVSGFSGLAAHLCRNKHVIDSLLQRPAGREPSLRWRSLTLYDRVRHTVRGAAMHCRRCA